MSAVVRIAIHNEETMLPSPHNEVGCIVVRFPGRGEHALLAPWAGGPAELLMYCDRQGDHILFMAIVLMDSRPRNTRRLEATCMTGPTPLPSVVHRGGRWIRPPLPCSFPMPQRSSRQPPAHFLIVRDCRLEHPRPPVFDRRSSIFVQFGRGDLRRIPGMPTTFHPCNLPAPGEEMSP